MDKAALRHLETAALMQGHHSAPSLTHFLIHTDNRLHFSCIYEPAAPFYTHGLLQKIPECVLMGGRRRTNGRGVNVTCHCLSIILREGLEGIVLQGSGSPKTLRALVSLAALV